MHVGTGPGRRVPLLGCAVMTGRVCMSMHAYGALHRCEQARASWYDAHAVPAGGATTTGANAGAVLAGAGGAHGSGRDWHPAGSISSSGQSKGRSAIHFIRHSGQLQAVCGAGGAMAGACSAAAWLASAPRNHPSTMWAVMQRCKLTRSTLTAWHDSPNVHGKHAFPSTKFSYNQHGVHKLGSILGTANMGPRLESRLLMYLKSGLTLTKYV